MIAILLAMAAVTTNCVQVMGAIAQDECLLSRSRIENPALNCDKSDHRTGLEGNVCSYREYLNADIELNMAWRKLIDILGFNSNIDDLTKSQQAWLKYREFQCKFSITWGISAINICQTEITKVRTDEIREIFYYISEQQTGE